MTDYERLALRCLVGVRMLPASQPKMFVRDLHKLKPTDELSERQTSYLFRLCWHFRKQIKNEKVVALGKEYHERYQQDKAELKDIRKEQAVEAKQKEDEKLRVKELLSHQQGLFA